MVRFRQHTHTFPRSLSLSFALSQLCFLSLLAYVPLKKIVTLAAILIDLKADSEDVVVEEKMDQGKIYPFVCFLFACMLFFVCLTSP